MAVIHANGWENLTSDCQSAFSNVTPWTFWTWAFFFKKITSLLTLLLVFCVVFFVPRTVLIHAFILHLLAATCYCYLAVKVLTYKPNKIKTKEMKGSDLQPPLGQWIVSLASCRLLSKVTVMSFWPNFNLTAPSLITTDLLHLFQRWINGPVFPWDVNQEFLQISKNNLKRGQKLWCK